jgi:uncharacterized protein YjbI with pentapeptide repeats
MANQEHLAVLRQGAAVWDAWLEDKPLFSADFEGADLAGLDLSGSDLRRARLKRANLEGTNLSGAQLFQADLRRALLAGAKLATADLSEADLRGAQLSPAGPDSAMDYEAINGVDANGAKLIGANLAGANLIKVNLANCDLREANLSGADLRHANLTFADLRRSDLTWCKLDHASFFVAGMGWTKLGSLDLSNVKGLNTITHYGPSSLGIDTCFSSKGRIPEAFLQGTGAPEVFISYARSLLSDPIQFYSCFISYSTNDQAFAERLYADLQNKGVRCWFAPHDIRGGRKLHEQIDEAIRVYDRLLLILSEHSMNSEWVKTEIANARQREIREQHQMLFPISVVPFERVKAWKAFDADTGKDSAREIREYFLPDFSNWKDHDSYRAAFERLLHDLKAEAGKAAPELH